ncbi:hypothetical protein LCGC14_0798490 [marine sediment metagenome]|uniref:Uncharacterized protein n=1 Tax=marine sediment metagenome TaxID=412755 RepID=A0A0F9QA80_9ZZZZ
MPVEVDPIIDAEKNREESSSPWLWFLDWTFSRAWVPNGLVAHWKLDDDLATTDVIDSSGNVHHGTLVGGDNTQDVNTAGKVSDAFQFNGVDDYVGTGDPFQSTLQGSFSVSLWVKPDDGQPAATQYIFHSLDITGSNSFVTIGLLNTGKISFTYGSEGNSGNAATTNAAVFPNGATQWTLITCVADSLIAGVGGKRIYVNGAEVPLDAGDDGDTSGVTFTSYTSAVDVVIAASKTDSGSSHSSSSHSSSSHSSSSSSRSSSSSSRSSSSHSSSSHSSSSHSSSSSSVSSSSSSVSSSSHSSSSSSVSSASSSSSSSSSVSSSSSSSSSVSSSSSSVSSSSSSRSSSSQSSSHSSSSSSVSSSSSSVSSSHSSSSSSVSSSSSSGTPASQVIVYVDPDATGAANGTSWTDAYTSLQTAQDTEKKDITASNEQYTFQCRSSGGTADTTSVVMDSGWTVGADNYIEIIGTDFPSDGIYDNTVYRIETSISHALHIKRNYVRVKKIQAEATNASGSAKHGIRFSNMLAGGSDNRIDSCIVSMIYNGTTNATAYIQSGNAGGVCTFYNCTALSSSVARGIGFQCDLAVTMNVYNSDVYGFATGYSRNDAGTMTVKNCIAGNCGNDFNGTITIDYCCSDDGDGTNSNGPSGGNWANELTNAAGGDFTPVLGGNILVAALNDPGSGLFSTDIIDDSYITDSWARGAYAQAATSSSSSSVSSASSSSSSVSSSSSSVSSSSSSVSSSQSSSSSSDSPIDDYYDGTIDDVMLFSQALPADEVSRIFDVANNQAVSETVYFVNNNVDLTYQSNLYKACNFNLGPWESVAGGALPRRNLTVSNADLVKIIHPFVRDYNGLIDSVVTATPVFAGAIDIDMSAKAMEFSVISTSAAEDFIAFVLGAPNPLLQSFPDGKYYADHCRYVKQFRGLECGYSGADTVCNGTYLDCFTKGNQVRFGGQIALRSKTVRFA